MPKSMNQTSPGCGTVLSLKLISQLVATGGRAQNFIFRAVCLDRERDCAALNDLFVKKLQCRPRSKSDLCQDGFSLAFQLGVNTAFGNCTHGPNVAQTWPFVHRLRACVFS